MKLQEYVARKSSRFPDYLVHRETCSICEKSIRTCYCSTLKPIQSAIQFVFLVHPEEARNKIATARMAHLNLRDSAFYVGIDFSGHRAVNQLISDPGNFCTVLYPGDGALNLNADSMGRYGSGKRWVMFVIDGTWRKVRRMLIESRNISQLQKVSFELGAASTFQIRRQPKDYCLSTIESVDRVLAVAEASAYPDQYSDFLKPFHYMVEQQKNFEISWEPYETR